MSFKNPLAVTAEQICYRREIEFYARQIHVLNKGKDDDWLKEYIAELLDTWQNDLIRCRDCFADVFKKTKELSKWQNSVK